MDDSFLAIVNPKAGGGKCGPKAREAVGRLKSLGLAIDSAETIGPGEATDIARRAYEKGRRKFISCGGDGTSFEIINGLFPDALDPKAERPLLGFLPMGTGNSFLKDFTNLGAAYAVDALSEGRRRPCDVVRITHKKGVLYYINIFSIGFVADVCVTRNRFFPRLGEAGYVLSVLKELTRLHPAIFPIKTNGALARDKRFTFVSVNNSRFTGGKMMMAPKASTSDGLADVIEVGPMKRLALLKAFPKIFKGTHVGLAAVETVQTRRVDFELSGEVDAMIDGEVIRLWPERIEVLPGAIDVCA